MIILLKRFGYSNNSILQAGSEVERLGGAVGRLNRKCIIKF